MQQINMTRNKAPRMHIDDKTTIRETRRGGHAHGETSYFVAEERTAKCDRRIMTILVCFIFINNTGGSCSSSSPSAAAAGMINIPAQERPRQKLPLARNVNCVRFAEAGV